MISWSDQSSSDLICCQNCKIAVAVARHHLLKLVLGALVDSVKELMRKDDVGVHGLHPFYAVHLAREETKLKVQP